MRSREVWEALCQEVEVEEGGKKVKRWVYDQRPVVYAWLAQRLEILHRRMAGEDVARNAPVLVLAGPPDSYKSFLQGKVLAPLFGNRVAQPEDFLTGNTNFNADLVAAEMLSMGDSPLGTSPDERRMLGEYLKKTIGQADHRLHMKGLDAVGTVYPVWSFVWTINDDKNNLFQLPPMVEGVVDKITMLHVNAVQLPINTDSLDDFTRFGNEILAQLPAFAHFLLKEFKTPEALKGGRWGVVAVQAPELMQEMFEDSPEGAFVDLLDAARFDLAGAPVSLWQWLRTRNEEDYGTVDKQGGAWVGTHRQLRAVLESTACSVAAEVERMFAKGKRLDLMLARLKKEQPDRVAHDRRKVDGVVKRMWTIFCPQI
jgi:hypothetical protein